MELRMNLSGGVSDAKIEDFYGNSQMYIYHDVHDLFVHKHNKENMQSKIFGLFIECGEDDNKKALMFDVEIDELEEMANAILKRIEIVRKNYSEQIKYQTDRGNKI